MKNSVKIAFLVVTVALTGHAQTDGWSLVWSDEFNSRSIDTNFWNYDLGTGDHGWGNGELQCYTKENISFSDTSMTIELRKQTVGAAEYTSARINTRKKVEKKYGKIQARVKAPYSQGVWPAVWTLGQDYDEVGWPACGEIDFFEMACGDNFADERGDNANFAVVHYTDLADFLSEQKKAVFVAGRMSDMFHVFTLEWDEKFLSFYFDTVDTPYFKVDITKPYMTEFHQPHSLVINMAFGGIGFAGYPDASTIIPQRMTVDWIRWYQKKTGIRDKDNSQSTLPRRMIEKNSKGLLLDIAFPSQSQLRIFDLRGRLLVDLGAWTRDLTPGRHMLAWNKVPMVRGACVAVFDDGGKAAPAKMVFFR